MTQAISVQVGALLSPINRLVAAVFATLVISFGSAQAAILPVTVSDPVITGSGDVAFSSGTFIFSGSALSAIGVVIAGTEDIDVVGSLDPAALVPFGTDTIFDVVQSSSPFGSLLNGAFSAFAIGDGVLELVFDIDGGSLASSFGAQVLITITGDWTAASFFTDLANGSQARITIQNIVGAPPVPLPAALPMFLAALGAGAVGRHLARRKAAAA